MLTIRHVEYRGRTELIREALQVWQSSDDEPSIVFVSVVGEEHPLRFADGTLQVINNGGHVIAEYNIDAMKPQIAEAA